MSFLRPLNVGEKCVSPHYDITVGHGALRLAHATWCPWTRPHYDNLMKHGAIGLGPHFYMIMRVLLCAYIAIIGRGAESTNQALN